MYTASNGDNFNNNNNQGYESLRFIWNELDDDVVLVCQVLHETVSHIKTICHKCQQDPLLFRSLC